MAENPRIEELRRRVLADPASIAFAALAEEFRRVGRHEEAIETCRTGLQRHPAYLSARVTLGRALIETGDYEGAREQLETVLRSAPENLAAIRGLAQIHERLGQSAEMDPHLAAMMNAEVERVALAAAVAPVREAPAQEAPVQVTPVQPEAPVQEAPVHVAPVHVAPPPPEPIVVAAAAMVLEPETDEIDAAEPDPVMLATLVRLERFLVAIDAARHP